MPVLSILIPSKNRADYAVSCLRALQRIRAGDVEFVLQDNSADDTLGRRVAALGPDPRVMYEHVGGPLSVIDNCNRAMARATGDYVTLVGDDDAATPEIVEAALWARANDLDALTPGRLVQYDWPDVRYKYYGAKGAGDLRIWPFTGRIVERDVTRGVREAAREAFQGLVDTQALPKLYYGLVKRSAFDALQRETGTCFPGVSPDMAAAIGVSRFVSRMRSIDYPIFVPGTSARSTAGANALKRHVGRLEDQPHLPVDCVRTWPAEIPAVFTVQTVWAQSGLSALRATRRDDLAAEFDVALLHAMCGVLNGGHFGLCYEHYRDWRRQTGQSAGALAFAGAVARAWLHRARWLVGRLLRRPAYVGAWVRSGVPDIEAAVDVLTGYLQERSWTFARVAAGAARP
jgi:hypothetical protein